MAMKFAQEISELDAAEYLGPCYEAVVTGCRNGINDENDLRKLSRTAVKQMWKQTKSYTMGLDERRERWGLELAIQ